MDFLIELLKSFATYFALIACAAVGVWAGITLRKKKNAKKDSAAEASEK
ncbi:MAG: hypothetical protein J5872_06710 [Lachnospiraceae bacterium]|nr:hypothetical protein [Lachnospiraceae bacterium]